MIDSERVRLTREAVKGIAFLFTTKADLMEATFKVLMRGAEMAGQSIFPVEAAMVSCLSEAKMQLQELVEQQSGVDTSEEEWEEILEVLFRGLLEEFVLISNEKAND